MGLRLSWQACRFDQQPIVMLSARSRGLRHLVIGTCSGVVFNHAGGVREYGIAEADMPFPLE